MNADEHPALSADDDGLPSLTLVLPEHLGHDLTLQGMVAAVGKVRSGLAFRVQLFRDLQDNCAARGDELRRALCRGQVLAGVHAAALIDEAIVEVFGLWDQYEEQILGLACDGSRPDAGSGLSAGERRAERGGRGPETSE
jgi:hypothetical protein